MALIGFNFSKINFDFVKYRYVSFTIAIVAVLSIFFSMGTKGINYGVDFKGGYILEVRMKEAPNLAELRQKLEDLKIGSVSLQKIGQSTNNDLMVKMERRDQEEDTQKGLERIKETLGDAEYRKIENIGPKVGGELARNALKAIIIALIAMLVYITARFQWNYALGAIIAQVYDCIIVMSLFTIFGYDFNESAIIGILTTAGYSINDTIVIFDRIRENIAKQKTLSLSEVINLSINETLSRTLLTVLTTMLALFAMYFFGGKVIADFSLPIILGIIAGTFSSIFIAAPLLLSFGFKKSIPQS